MAVTQESPKPALTAFESWSPASLARWSPAAFPTGDGGTWTWAEPGAQVHAEAGRLVLAVPRFTRSHDTVQIFDNPKHLLACRDPIPVPDGGVEVEVSMGATMHPAAGEDWDLGFASFNLMDFEHGLILDGLADGTRTAILFERLHIPGMIPEDQAWTAIADGPRSPRPGTEHIFRFRYEPAERRARGWIDGVPVLEVKGVPFRITAFTPGIGVITLARIRDGRSQSLRDQGCTATVGAIHVVSP